MDCLRQLQQSRLPWRRNAQACTRFDILNALHACNVGFMQAQADEVQEALRLLRYVHVEVLQGGLSTLPAGFTVLDASRTWLVYWIVHSLAMLGADLGPRGPSPADVAVFIGHCQHPQGGFGGSPMQLAHLATTYASVGALVTLGGESALQVVDRNAMYGFLCRMIISPEDGGGFRIHDGGSHQSTTSTSVPS